VRVALHNIHLIPNLQFHGYVINLLRTKKVQALYFSDRNVISMVKTIKRLLMKAYEGFDGIDWNQIEFIFSTQKLSQKVDVLLNLNLLYVPNLDSELSYGVSKFNGLKIFHVGDYFWYHPGSEKYNQLKSAGVDHLFGYAMHDRYCKYFETHFPKYRGRTWGIPFGYAPRFCSTNPFNERKNKAVAVGSVNPLRSLHEQIYNYHETADFYPDESWFHRFRREIILNKSTLQNTIDSMLPEFPDIKDFKYDLVAKFNEYRMFVSCESIFFFPPAKIFEGIASGSVLICADHDCNKEYGFKDGENCIMFETYNISELQSKIFCNESS